MCRTLWPVQVRPEVDGVYGSLVGLMFATLEKLAAADAKHGDRLRWGVWHELVQCSTKHKHIMRWGRGAIEARVGLAQ